MAYYYSSFQVLVAQDEPELRDDCLNCVDDIVDAVADCDGAVEPGEVVNCVIDALAATSDCLLCVCDVLNIFLNGTVDGCVVSTTTTVVTGLCRKALLVWSCEKSTLSIVRSITD